MPCWKSASHRVGRLLATLLVVWLAFLAVPPVLANDIEPLDARISLEDDDVILYAEFSINLGSRLEDALQRGIPLSFKLECVIERPRDYWVGEHIASYAQNYRLSYSGLTRQYRLAIGSLHQSFSSLNDALRVLGRANAITVAERTQLRPATRFDAAVRLSLDASQLPKPFQLDALTSNAWKVDAKTKRWSFSTP